MTVPQDTLSTASPSFTTDSSTFEIVDTREQMNKILIEASTSPIRSQTRVSLKRQSRSSLRRLLSKLNRDAQIFQGTNKNKIKNIRILLAYLYFRKVSRITTPDQKDESPEMVQLQSGTHNEREANVIINNEIINNLKEIYTLYVERRMPFIEQVRLLSLLPRSMSCENIVATFGCSRHAIKSAHRMQDNNESFPRSEKEITIRQCANSEKVKHFVSWLIESNIPVLGRVDFESFPRKNNKGC